MLLRLIRNCCKDHSCGWRAELRYSRHYLTVDQNVKSGYFLYKRGWNVVLCIPMVSRNHVHVLRWSIPVMAKALFPRAWVKKSFYFQVTGRSVDNFSAMRIKLFLTDLCVIGCVEVPGWQLAVNMFMLSLPSCVYWGWLQNKDVRITMQSAWNIWGRISSPWLM